MPMDKKIFLDETLLIGKGGHKDVYIHPQDPSRCIKINTRSDDDHKKEMNYRKSRERRHLPPSSLLVQYYGAVDTNLGEGYVFERVFDYDGSTSKTIDELIRLEIRARNEKKSVKEVMKTEKEIPPAATVLFTFREVLFKENIIIPDMGAFNYVVQFDTPKNWRVRIVDDIGSPTLIPIVYYIDFLGAGHVRRRWLKFIREIMTLYPGFLSDEESHRLMVIK